jgi:hypothetical protein
LKRPSNCAGDFGQSSNRNSLALNIFDFEFSASTSSIMIRPHENKGFRTHAFVVRRSHCTHDAVLGSPIYPFGEEINGLEKVVTPFTSPTTTSHKNTNDQCHCFFPRSLYRDLPTGAQYQQLFVCAEEESGISALLELRRYPSVHAPTTYHASVASLDKGKS